MTCHARALLLAVCGLLAVTFTLRDAVAQTELRVGVRTDAAPFSYFTTGRRTNNVSLPGPLMEENYDGFIVYICDRALLDLQRKMGDRLSVKVVPVNARNRFEMLRDNEIEVICDPATMTRERMRNFMASMPLYLSGITFASQPSIPANYCNSIVGFVGRTTAETKGISLILDRGEWPQFAALLRDHMARGEDWTEVNFGCQALIEQGRKVDNPRPEPIRLFETHAEVAQAFCNKEILYYVGDIEIVSRSLSAQGECKFTDASKTYSDDRYTIFARTDIEDKDVAAVTMRFMESLSRVVYSSPSALDLAFEHTFPGYQASQKLKLFNWAIRGPVTPGE